MIKRLFDLSLALFLIVLFFPLMALCGGLIFFNMGRPIFFCQDRPGLNGEIFKIYKFHANEAK